LKNISASHLQVLEDHNMDTLSPVTMIVTMI